MTDVPSCEAPATFVTGLTVLADRFTLLERSNPIPVEHAPDALVTHYAAGTARRATQAVLTTWMKSSGSNVTWVKLRALGRSSEAATRLSMPRFTVPGAGFGGDDGDIINFVQKTSWAH
ncbi:hypothetical protein [Allorhodopirellula heiligendammensis]|uniref:hypothetical protein n=1 Tax=Allorhodopirellula heiligendammensis TaxID=2714739 RepID=UPI00265E8F2A|nr:hypothetical protein [Allorhodopirellula heiligendammensis]